MAQPMRRGLWGGNTSRLFSFSLEAGRLLHRPSIGIGGSLAAPPLPHHRTYGPVYGGSADYATGAAATEGRPSALRTALERAMFSAGLLLSRQGPCGAPAVCAAKSWPTPRRRSSAKRVP